MKDVAPLQIVPAAYYIRPINDQWAWGLAMFTTYGVATDYPNEIYAGDLVEAIPHSSQSTSTRISLIVLTQN